MRLQVLILWLSMAMATYGVLFIDPSEISWDSRINYIRNGLILLLYRVCPLSRETGISETRDTVEGVEEAKKQQIRYVLVEPRGVCKNT